MKQWTSAFQGVLNTSVAIVAIAMPTTAWAQARSFDIPSQSAATAIPELARQADVQILVSNGAVRGKQTAAIKGTMTVQEALRRLLRGTGLRVASNDGRTFTLADAAGDMSVADQAEGPSPEGDQHADKGEDVVVTGTRIYNPNMKSAAPVQSVSAQEIALSGAVNIEDVLNRLPQVIPNNPATEQEGTGQSNISLRSFGAGGGGGPTLTLIDGLRVTGGGGGDVNLIPTSLIERVDVLTGGAAATYGADAIAGVVNFVLKRNFTGLAIDADYGLFDHYNGPNAATATAGRSGMPYTPGHVDDGGRGTLNISAGKQLFDNRLSISSYFTYRHTDPMSVADRSYDACQMLQSAPGALPTCGVTRTSYNGVIIPQAGPNAGNLLVNNPDGVTQMFHPFTSTDYISRYGSSYQLLHSNTRYNAGGFLTLKVTDWAEVYGSALYENNKYINSYDPTSIYAGEYNGSGYTLNCNNPLMSAQQAQAICGSAAGTSTIVPIDIRYRLNAYPVQIITDRQYQMRGTLGVRGDFGGAWHYDVGGVYSSSLSYRIIDSNWNQDPDRISNALNVVNYNGVPTCVAKINGTDPACVPLNVFVANTNNLASYNYIFKGSSDGTQRSLDVFADGLATLSGDLGHYGLHSPLASDGVQIALNAEYRREVASNYTDAEYNTVLSGSPNPGGGSSASQHIVDYGFETNIPLIEDKPWTKFLGVNGGYRRSKYSTDTHVFGTWKVEGSWAPTQDIRFRYSRNFSSAAPGVYQANPATSFRQVTGQDGIDPCGPTPVLDSSGKVTGYAAPQFSITSCRQQTGWKDSYYNNLALLCPDTGCVYRSTGQPNLGPTEANSYTIGAVITPRFIPRLSLSVDRYTIRFVNQIAAFAPEDFYAACQRYAANPTAINLIGCQHFYRNANGQIFGNTNDPSSGFVSGDTINVPDSTGSQGWDFQGHYDFPLAHAGRVAMDFNGGLITNAGSATNTAGHVGYFGYFVGGNPIVKWRNNLRTTFTTDNGVFQASVNWRHISGALNSINYCPLFTNGTPCNDPNLFGPGYTPEVTFAKIPAYNYFDLALNVNIAKRMTWGVTINNLFDKDPPLVPALGGLGSYGINGFQNAVVYLYDPYGRYIQMNVKVRF